MFARCPSRFCRLTIRSLKRSFEGMNAWLIDDFKGIGGLRLTEVPDPVPRPDDAILRVHYAALNPADRYLAENQYPAKPALPHILGRDGLGTVVQIDRKVDAARVGDRSEERR